MTLTISLLIPVADKMLRFYESMGLYHNRKDVTTSSLTLRACRQPGVEIKYPAIALFTSAVRYPWGVLSLFSTEGMS